MSEISRVALFGKLNPLAYKAIEGATVFCKMRGNPYVELVHWLAQIAADAGHRPRIASCATTSSTRPTLARGHHRARSTACRAAPPRSRDFSEHIENAVERGWVYGTLMFGEAQVRTGYIMVGMLKTPGLRNRAAAASRAQFEKHQASTTWPTTSPRSATRSPEAKLARQDGTRPGRRGAARRGQRRDGAGRDGQAGGAEEVRGRPDRASARRARSTR